MDRFIAIRNCDFGNTEIHLKSNMDRFIVK